MLEAIIAFMPIKEDHEAIGAVDFPTEIRKTLAKNSQHFKCDECGLVADLLPPKVKKVEQKPQQNTDNNKQYNNNSEDINENVSINKPTITETSFEKNKSSNLNQESKPLNTLNDLITSPQIENLIQSQKIESKQSIKNEQPGNKQDSQINKKGVKVNFQEYFKKLHEKEEKNKEERETKQEEIINTSVPPNETQEEKKQNIEEDNDSFNESPSTFDSDFAEEFDFYEVQKTIQCYYNKPKIEIEKELNEKNSSDQSNFERFNPFKVSKEEKSIPIDYTPKKKSEKEIALLSQLLKKEKNMMKFYSRVQYDKTKKESMKKLNLTMIGIISLVTILYISVRLVLKKLE